MLNKNKLRAVFAEKGVSQKEVAQKIGISEATFSRKLKNGKFGIDEAEKMIKLLDIKEPLPIFFAK